MNIRSSGPGEDPRTILAFALFAALAIAIPLAMAWFAPTNARFAEASAIWCIVAGSAAKLSLLALRGEMRILSLTFWIFVYVWLGIAPFTQMMNDSFPLPGYYTATDVIIGALVVILGLVFFQLGFYIANRIPFGPDSARMLLWRSVSVNRTIVLAIFAVIIAFILIWQLGGPSTFMASRREVFSAFASVTGKESQDKLQLLIRSLRVPPFVSLCLLLWIWLRHRINLDTHKRICVLSLLGATALINALVNNPLNSARYLIGTIGLSIAFIAVPWRKTWSFAVWTLILVGALLVIFPYADIFRHEIDVSDVYFEGIDPVIDQGHYDAFQQTINAVNFVNEEGIRAGRQLLGTALFWVPRRIWTDKPIPSGPLVAEHHGYRATKLSMPLWGEAYVDGGFIFTAIVLMAYGIFVGILERRFLSYVTGGRAVPELFAVLVPVLAAYQIYLLRGPLMGCVAYLAPIVLLFVLTSKSTKGVT
jgi:hypothetical protein